MANKLWNGEITAKGIHTATSVYTFKELRKGLFKTLGGGFDTLKPGTPLYNRAAQIELDALLFSALKNNRLCAAMSSLKSFGVDKETFMREFKLAFDTSYITQLDAELDHVRAVTESAKQWSEAVERAADGFDWLKYHTMQDERVRDEHRPWDNIKLPLTHSFWRTHYPPNGYRCRCYATSDFEGPEVHPLESELKANPLAAEFRRNFGADGKAFTGSPTHPYIKDFDFAAMRPLNLQINALKTELQAYTQVKGTAVYEHPLINPAEVEMNRKQAVRLSKTTGAKITLTPDAKLTGFKNPDSIAAKKPVEFKHITGSNVTNTIKRDVSHAGKQGAHTVCLFIETEAYNKAAVIRALKAVAGQPENYTGVKLIVLQLDFLETDILIERDRIGDFDFDMLP
ncbi:MAG: hypothetical protein F9K23_00770 [Bacteroidetes bacterium]|nr:MAG: hypothetical protein F9K23_00770 [Bacteroidota bacterium]